MTQMNSLPDGYEYCQRCGTTAFKQTQFKSQKYCAPCSKDADRERRSHWARKTKDTRSEQNKAIAKKSRDRKREHQLRNGPLLSAVTISRRIAVPSLLWEVTIPFPFSYDGSKNAIWSLNGRGHVFNRQEATAYRGLIATGVAAGVKNAGHKFVHGRLWFSIFVKKPNHKGDAVNFVDIVSDAIEDASGIDDRWYSLGGVDWEIVKHEPPTLYVTVAQESDQYHVACSSCGRVLTLDKFTKNRSSKHGVGRNCRECSTMSPANE